MPLISPEDYEKLGDHLKKIDPVLSKWCSEKGFVEDNSRGRYPNRCYRRHSDVSSFIELSMQYDRDGKCFERFFPEIPYWFVLGIHAADKGRRIVLFRDMPFHKVTENLPLYLKLCEFYLHRYTMEYLEKSGEEFMMPFLEIQDALPL